MTTKRETLSDLLRRRRAALRMSQPALAAASGVPQSTIAGLESGKHRRSIPSTWLALARALEVDVRELLQAAVESEK